MSRIFYRNTFLHIGHSQTLLYNNHKAEENDGVCYAIIDDRQNPETINNIQADIDYLNLKHIKVISVSSYKEEIETYTKDLARSGLLYLSGDQDAQKGLTNPKSRFQIRLKFGDWPTIGYSKQIDDKYIIIYIFDYVIKVLDELLRVNNIITTSTHDISDLDIDDFFRNRQSNQIKYHNFKTYKIYGFRYTKNEWPSLKENDPRLMTLKGLKSRHIPDQVIHNFYQLALHQQEHGQGIKIGQFDTLLRNHLVTCDRVFGVINPLKVTITNFEDRYIEYIMKPIHPLRKDTSDDSTFNIVPLTSTFYIERSDFSPVHYRYKVSKNREIRLKYGDIFYCTDVCLAEDGQPLELKGRYYKKDVTTDVCIHWQSGDQLRDVKFYNYNWFFTGDNHINLKEPQITDGYIDEYVFKDLDKIYQLEQLGFYTYDHDLSKQENKPCFIKVCNIC